MDNLTAAIQETRYSVLIDETRLIALVGVNGSDAYSFAGYPIDVAEPDIGDGWLWDGDVWDLVPLYSAAQIDALTIGSLADVDVTGAVAGNTLVFDGALWAPGAGGGGGASDFADLTGFLANSQIPLGEITLDRLADAVYTEAEVDALVGGLVSDAELAAWAGSVNIATVGTLLDLTVTNPIVGSLTGNAATATLAAAATILAAARTINGVAFDGSQDITISAAADAGTLTGTTLAANVVTSSLTTIGTLVDGTVPAERVKAGIFQSGAFVFGGAVSGVTALTTTGTVILESTILTVGHTAALATYADADAPDGTTVSPTMQFRSGNGIGQSRFTSAVPRGPALMFGRSKSNTTGVYTEVASGDRLFTLVAAGADGVDMATTAAMMRAEADGAVTANRVPGRWTWWTAEGVANNDAKEKMRLSSAGVLSVGLVVPTSGSRFEVQGATGSAVPVPVISRIRSTSSGQDWAIGASNFWGSRDWWSDDGTSPPGASVRARISVHAENAAGTLTGMALWVGPTGGPTIALTIGSTLLATFAGAVAVTGALAISNTLSAVSPTAPNRTITMVVNGTTVYIPCKLTND